MCWDRVIACESAEFEQRLVAVLPTTPLAIPVPSAASGFNAEHETLTPQLVS